MNRAGLTANQQTAMLADRYTQRAEAYEATWSPIIRPVGELLISHLPLSSTTRSVVDIGTGAGASLPAIKRGEQYLYQGDVFMATAVKADHPSDNC